MHRLANAFALAILAAGESASGDILVSYAIDPSTSVIRTSGGAGGGGIGDLEISGTFDFHVFDQALAASTFENIAVSTLPTSGYAFPDFVGFDLLDSISAFLQRGTASNPLDLPDNIYFALFDKFTHEMDITGVYYQPVLDGLVYEYTIRTTVVPEPSSVVLDVSALLAVLVLTTARRAFSPARRWSQRCPAALDMS